jgi:hypothetical protein
MHGTIGLAVVHWIQTTSPYFAGSAKTRLFQDFQLIIRDNRLWRNTCTSRWYCKDCISQSSGAHISYTKLRARILPNLFNAKSACPLLCGWTHEVGKPQHAAGSLYLLPEDLGLRIPGYHVQSHFQKETLLHVVHKVFRRVEMHEPTCLTWSWPSHPCIASISSIASSAMTSKQSMWLWEIASQTWHSLTQDCRFLHKHTYAHTHTHTHTHTNNILHI